MELEQSRAANVPSGEWHQRIERREDSWETHRSCLFEYVVGTEKLLKHNVSIHKKWVVWYMRKDSRQNFCSSYTAINHGQQLNI